MVTVKSEIEVFAEAVKKHMPKAKGTQRICCCPCCKGLLVINRHEFDNKFYAICTGCMMTLRG